MDRRTCLVTGASRGIGLAIAERFARDGWNLAIAARGAAALRAAAAKLEALGGACEAVAGDVGTPAGAAQVAERALARFGRIDVVVNNAGVAPRAVLENTSDDAYEQTLRANVSSVFYVSRAAWPRLKSQGGGTIVNLSSIASTDPFPGFVVYGACKAWVNVFTKALAEEGRPLGIRVFAVAPGAVETDMLRGAFPDFPRDQTLAPRDVADVVYALCQEPLRCASGQTVFVRK